MKRKIININENLCNGCGNCIPNCPEGAIQIIDNKARLISDIFCDGLGACIGHCPEEAITIEERETEKYSEYKVMENIVKKGENTIIAHLKHLEEHREFKLLDEAKQYLRDNNIKLEDSINLKKEYNKKDNCHGHSCPGSKEMNFKTINNLKNIDFSNISDKINKSQKSQLKQWPIQMSLLSENASFFRDSDLLISADCVGYSDPNLHNNLMKNRSIAICCPKLDDFSRHIEKMKAIIEINNIKSITVAIMEVPCCSALYHAIKKIVEESGKKIPINKITVKINGNYT